MKIIVRIKKKVIALVMFFLLSTVNFFVKTDDKTILFIAFDGRGFLDNPKAIFEAIKADDKFKNYQLVWALNQPINIQGSKVIRKNLVAIIIIYPRQSIGYLIIRCRNF